MMPTIRRLLKRAVSGVVESRREVDVEALARLLGSKYDNLPQTIDDVARLLSRKIVDAHPQMTFLNERFRDYELALTNVKQLGYELGRLLAAQRLNRPVGSPARVGLKSKLCTQADVERDWFTYWCQELKTAPIYHRKLWELTYITQALWDDGKLAPGMHGLGFGCGEEPLPSLFAKYGVTVLATDLDPERPEAKGWRDTGQHASAAETLRHRNICADEQLLSNIDFRPVDMNAIPEDLAQKFDFCWSACSLEHLGSIAKGLDFIRNSLKTLRPGGVAVHTTEFNLSESSDIIDNWGTVLYHKGHFEELAESLNADGYQVAPMDFDQGTGVLDGFVDVPPFGWHPQTVKLLEPSAHLRLSVDGFPCTSFGIIVKVPA